jgi:hypothetical protein
VANFTLIVSALNLCAFGDACKHFGLSDVTLCIYRRFDDTLFETSASSHPWTQRYIPEHWVALSYFMNVIVFSIFELHTEVFWDVIPAGVQLPVEKPPRR